MSRIVIGRDPATSRCIKAHINGEFVVAVDEARPAEAEHCDLWISPGLVDLQVNGYRGIDLNDDGLSVEMVLDLTRALALLGTTTWLATIITASHDAMLTRLRIVSSARALYPEVKHAIVAIHLEGPAISPNDGYRGAHPVAHVRSPSIAEFNALQSAADGIVRLVTLSPHWTGSTVFIRALKERGITVAIGHTHAPREQINAAVDAGATLSTHLGNGIAPELQRHPNPIWAQLAEDRLSATLIADGMHLSEDIFHVMLRAKTIERAILISDSVALAGAPPCEYRSSIGGHVLVGEDGAIRIPETGLLAGSGIALHEAVARAPLLGHCTLADSIRMATCNPANAVGIARGSIAAGSFADMILFRWKQFDSSLSINEVIVRGSSVA